MAEVTLTASMRSNLYSLQQTANLMGTVQNRLSTGKKVNSALDNPNNYFTAQSLTNRANDINSLLDGMGQAIQAIKSATQGIESAQKIVDQMKAVANSALQSTSGSNAQTTTTVVASGAQGTLSAAGAIVASTADTTDLRQLVDAAGAQIFQGGATLTLNNNGGGVKTFTLNDSAATTATGDGNGKTLADLATWVSNNGGALSIDTAGKLKITTTSTTNGQTLVVGGTMTGANAIKAETITVAGGVATAGTLGSVAFNTANSYTGVPKATGTTKLVNLTSSNGGLITDGGNPAKAGAIAVGDTLKVAINGVTSTFTVNSTSTIDDVSSWLHTLNAGLTASIDSAGSFTVNNATGYTVTVDASGTGVGAKLMGISTNGTIANNASVNNTLYAGKGDLTIGSASTLASLTSKTGTAITSGDTLTVKLNGATTTISYGTATGQVDTVGELLDQLNAISGVQAALDSSGKLSVTATNGQDLTIGGTNMASKLGIASASAKATAPSATSISQFDALRSQLDQLVKDASYQGINLLSSTSNSPLTVTFNEAAVNANKLVINAVDMTSTGLGVNGASGKWTDSGAIQTSISQLTNAATTLRVQASTFGQNLTTVQTRQDFATNMIATLKEGADKLTLADMNEEGANMLALQTRSQLGTQSLSLASQANQAVMRLFG